MKWIARIIAASVGMLALAVPVAGAAANASTPAVSNQTASAPPSAKTAPSGLANCTYKVTRTVKVYEKPTNASRHLTTKHKGDKVRGFSRLTYLNTVEHVRYRAVDTKKARDGIGWMDSRALKLIRCDR